MLTKHTFYSSELKELSDKTENIIQTSNNSLDKLNELNNETDDLNNVLESLINGDVSKKLRFYDVLSSGKYNEKTDHSNNTVYFILKGKVEITLEYQVLQDGKVQIDVKVTGDEDAGKIDYSKSKYVLKTSPNKIGTDPSLYTGGSLDSSGDKEIIISPTSNEYYLHILFVDLDNNATELVSDVIYTMRLFNVTYNVNGGRSMSVMSQIKKEGENLTLLTEIPTKANCEFVGWGLTSTAEYEDKAYDPGGTYSQDSDIELFAIWEQIPVAPTVVIESNGYTGFTITVSSELNNIDHYEVHYGLGNTNSTKTITTSNKSTSFSVNYDSGGIGYAYANVTNTKNVTSPNSSSVSAQNQRYSATVNYNGGQEDRGDTSSTKTVYRYEGSSFTAPSKTSYGYRSGYELTGYKDGNGNSVSPGGSFTVGPLTAQWSSYTVPTPTCTITSRGSSGFTISFSTNAIWVSKVTVYYKLPTSSSTTGSSYESREFTYSSGSYSSTTSDSFSVSCSYGGRGYAYCIVEANGQSAKTSSTVNVYNNELTITYNGNGGQISSSNTSSSTSVTQYYNRDITLRSKFYRSGYEQTYWGTSSSGGTKYSPGSSYTVTSSRTLYAIWEKNSKDIYSSSTWEVTNQSFKYGRFFGICLRTEMWARGSGNYGCYLYVAGTTSPYNNNQGDGVYFATSTSGPWTWASNDNDVNIIGAETSVPYSKTVYIADNNNKSGNCYQLTVRFSTV